MEDNEKIYFNPGDVVRIKHSISNKMNMLVIDKVTNPICTSKNNRFTDPNKSILRGIRCVWFTTDGRVQEYVFNTKDLEHVK